MAIKQILLGVVVSIVLAACQCMGGTERPPVGVSNLKCSGSTCDVSVTVDASCVVKVDPEVLDLREGRETQEITWKLNTKDYEFSKDPLKYAIVIKSDDASGQVQSPSNHGTSITVKFKHKNPGKYFQYGVNVVRSDGLRCSTKDPWFVE